MSTRERLLAGLSESELTRVRRRVASPPGPARAPDAVLGAVLISIVGGMVAVAAPQPGCSWEFGPRLATT